MMIQNELNYQVAFIHHPTEIELHITILEKSVKLQLANTCLINSLIMS